jgi:hypothetical protein
MKKYSDLFTYLSALNLLRIRKKVADSSLSERDLEMH